MFFSKLYFILVFIYILGNNTTWTMDSCRTSWDVSGTCMDIKDCEYFYKFIKNNDEQQYPLILKNKCSNPKEVPDVCCPNKEYVTKSPKDLVQEIESVELNPFKSPKYESKDSFTIAAPAATQKKQKMPAPPICGKIDMFRRPDEDTTKLTAHPWAALLEYENTKEKGLKTEFRCGGSLISDRFVVTSAHCAHEDINDGWQIFRVRLGEWDLRGDPDCVDYVDNRMCADKALNITVDQIYLHPLFEIKDIHHDIALLHLKTQVHYSTYVKPICLSSITTLFMQSLPKMVVGWDPSDKDSKTLLKQVSNVITLSNNACNSFYSIYGSKITENLLCVKGTSRNYCHGDSLILVRNETYYLLGVTAFSDFYCNELIMPVVYTNINNYYSWIYNLIGITEF